MEKKVKSILLVIAMLIMTGSSTAFAAGESSSNAVVNGLTGLVKMPITMLQKAGDSMDSASNGPLASEDVVVSDVFDLDAEITG